MGWWSAFSASLGGLQFLAPLALWGFAALPLLWWLLRVTPPAPKKLVFPALSLLQDLPPIAQSPAQTPWWLLLLRLILLALLFLGLARPVLTPNADLPGSGPLIILIDNSWAAGGAWPVWQASLGSLCAEAERGQRSLLIIPTAPSQHSGVLNPIGPAPALTTCPTLAQLQPQAWPADHTAALQVLKEKRAPGNAVIWFNDGLRTPATDALDATLSHDGPLTVYQEERPHYLLQAPPQTAMDALAINVMRAAADEEAAVLVTAQDKAGKTLGIGEGHFAARDKNVTVRFDLPGDLRNQTARLVLQDSRNAGTVWLLDGRNARHQVGLIGDEVTQREQPLLNGLHYLERALNAHNDVGIGALDTLLARKAAIIVNTNERALLPEAQAKLAAWVQQGGVLVQFAGPELATDSTLLPTPLRQSRRDLGGIFSWAKPQGMQAFPKQSPFTGLTVPNDVTVSQQLLADPATLNGDTSWALLADGTPLVTGARQGRGYAVLFHVPASPGWSSLPLSGLFMQMLNRLVELGVSGSVVTEGTATLPPVQLLNGFGQLQPADARASALTPAEQKAYTPSPEHPPGYYGAAPGSRAFNLGQGIASILPFTPAHSENLRAQDNAHELRPWLLGAALLLLLLDMALALFMRGLVRLRPHAALMLLLLAAPTHAETSEQTALSDKIWLGTVTNGAGGRSDIAELGMEALAARVKQKTAVDQIGSIAINLEQDDLTLVPFLYWPLSENPQLSPQAQQKLQDFFAHGGMLLIDLASDPENNLTLRESGMPLPMLAPVKPDHPLYRTFYLLQDCPGRTDDGTFWSERDVSGRQDNVPALFIGARDWASAWASGGRGTRQQEMAMRCGLNLVMYALTGNYKMDQIHVQTIMERLNR